MKLKYNPALYHRALAAYLGMSRLRADRSRLRKSMRLNPECAR